MLCIPLMPLESGRLAKVDARDFWWLAGLAWRESNGYAVYQTVDANGGRTTLFMHRLILDAPDGMDTDHIDGDGTNNCRSNIRICTTQQNMWNRKKAARTSRGAGMASRYKGVAYRADRPRRPWKAKICINGRSTLLGIFVTEQEAALAYDAAARQHFGAFACTNFPLPGERPALSDVA